eukprot:TRINITY_DN70142_c0_g1_i1.p1 TRINITY_DN70142_c0_g1~~TRINITY_DN70142_c0_g1_i1.p1  ORF type:complete len:394 (-),score=94.50 TRINITY_DN70142_c0_g1_i1:219-1400(-)
MKAIVPAVFFGVVALVAHLVDEHLKNILDVYKELRFDDSSCKLLEIPTPVEDFSAFGDGHSLLAGGGDLMNTFEHGSRSVVPGAVWLINVTARTATELAIEGEDVPSKLVLHGVHFSQASKRLFAVNHNEEQGESVEVFEVLAETAPPRLRHLKTIRSPLFKNMALNDVVEGVGDEIYVTEWQPYGLPPGGKDGGKGTFEWKINHMKNFANSLLKLGATTVYRCAFAGEVVCEVATESVWTQANGITISNDRQLVYVNDPIRRQITVLRREPSGKLKEVSHFALKHALDNIDFCAEGELCAGSIPLLHTCPVVCEEGMGRERVVDGRPVGCSSSPGGMLSIRLDEKLLQPVEQSDVALHDGSKLSGVSAGVRVKAGGVALGSYISKGVLVCHP